MVMVGRTVVVTQLDGAVTADCAMAPATREM
jgi:hypothetical protein